MVDESSDPTVQAAQTWANVLSILKQDTSITARNWGWLEGVTPEAVFGTTIVLCVSSSAAQQALQGEMNEQLMHALKLSTGQDMFPAFKIVPQQSSITDQTSAVRPETAQLQESAPLHQHSTPDTATQSSLAQSALAQPSLPLSDATQRTTAGQPMAAEQLANAGDNAYQPYATDDFSSAQRLSPTSGSGNTRQQAAPGQTASQPPFDTNQFDATRIDHESYSNALTGQFATIHPDSGAPATAPIGMQQQAPSFVPAPVQPIQQPQQNQQTMPAPAAQPTQQYDQQKIARDPQTHLNKNSTFDTFVPGDSNRFARTVALAVAEGSGKDFNPLCIYGGPGLGKTHLLNAIGNYALVKDSSLKVRYVTSEEFTNEFIEALQNPNQSEGQIAAFNRRYREVDVLLIDDIQFLAGKNSTMEQFFHTFNSLYQANKRIVIASDVAPKNLKGFQARLISRFESGLTVDIKPPDLETRTAILRMMAANNHASVPNDVLDLIAERFTESIRELEGALTRVTAVASLSNQPVSTALAERALHDLYTSDVEIKPTDIIGQVAKYFHLTFDDLVGRGRTKNVALARQIAMYLTREMTSMSLVDIGEVFGGRDHTTVMHAYTRISGEMQEKQEIYNYVMELTVRLKQQPSE